MDTLPEPFLHARTNQPHGKSRESVMLVPENSPVVFGDPGVWYVTESKPSPQDELMSLEQTRRSQHSLARLKLKSVLLFHLGGT